MFRINGFSALGSLDPGDVNLAHRHHRFEMIAWRRIVGIAVGT